MTISVGNPALACVPVPQGPRGTWVYLWPKNGTAKMDVSAAVIDCVGLGVAGVIAQNGMTAPAWIAPHVATIRGAVLGFAVGYGMDGSWSRASTAVKAFQAGWDLGPSWLSLDWERTQKWETTTGNTLAAAIVAQTLEAWPGAALVCADAPWWAPLTTSDGHPTHPHAPTQIFSQLCPIRRVQAYGAPTIGASARMLAWARSPSQYPSLGTPAGMVAPTYQGYKRATSDVVTGLLADPCVVLWDYLELDKATRTALYAVKVLTAQGYTGADAVQRFQASVGLTVDGICGPKTLAALGVA